MGLAFDGDADRVFLVDEKAQPVPGSLTTSIVAASVLEREPGATILHNLICSKAVPEVIRENEYQQNFARAMTMADSSGNYPQPMQRGCDAGLRPPFPHMLQQILQ